MIIMRGVLILSDSYSTTIRRSFVRVSNSRSLANAPILTERTYRTNNINKVLHHGLDGLSTATAIILKVK